jgi:hypothetical protein
MASTIPEYLGDKYCTFSWHIIEPANTPSLTNSQRTFIPIEWTTPPQENASGIRFETPSPFDLEPPSPLLMDPITQKTDKIFPDYIEKNPTTQTSSTRLLSRKKKKARRIKKPHYTFSPHTWTKDDDEKLIKLYEKYGKKWKKIVEKLPFNVSVKQVSSRYTNYLNPKISHEPWTEAERRTIRILQRVMGNKWAKIAQYMPGRSASNIKNIWYGPLKNGILKTRKTSSMIKI